MCSSDLESRPEAEVSGLWCNPSGPDPDPLPEFTDPALVLDDLAFADVLAKVLRSYRDDTTRDEHILACFVATAHARGRDVVTAAFENLDRFDTDTPLQEALARFLGRPVNKLVYHDLNNRIQKIINKWTTLDIEHTTIQQYEWLLNDTNETIDEIGEFGYCVEDVLKHVYNKLVAEPMDKTKKAIDLDERRRIITEDGLKDNRIKNAS